MRILLTIAFTHFIYFAFTQVKGTLKDARDGKSYNTIEIGNQVWMAENLNVDRFRNGDPIKEITSNEEWVQAGKNGTPGWCYYNNDPANGLKYGKLYNWHAVNDPRGLAPEGWHVPSTEECKTLINQQGGFGQAGLKMKSSDTWYGGGGYNKDGFNGLAGGRRGKNGNFSSLGVYFFWWTSSKYNNEGADYCYLEKSKDSVKIELMYNERGFSVRCVKEKAEKESDINTKSLEEWAEDSQKRLQDASSKSSSKVPNKKSSGPAANLKSVVIGTQTWTSENLNVSTFRNGDPIPEVRSTEEWKKAGENKQPAWCYYNNDPKNGEKYGKLYNWYAVSDPRGIAPNGWHVPSEDEWLILEKHLGENIGKKMKNSSGWGEYEFNLKCTNCSSWNDEYRKKTACNICKDTRLNGKGKKSGNGDNSSGFTALPGDFRNYHGSFGDITKMVGGWWSSTSINENKASEFSLTSPNDYTIQHNNDFEKGIGCSLRLIKN
jgi:uncharacterized protein (TIGR02145 family)